MTLFFPKEYQATSYRTLYDNLSPIARQMIQREFIGVSYLYRFYLLKTQKASGNFRSEQLAAGNFIHQKLTISRLNWLNKELLTNHLKIIFRHYLFGFLIQFASRKHELNLPAPSPSCYWETPVNLVVMRWLNRHTYLWETELEKLIEQVISKSIRHHFIYILLIFQVASKIYNRETIQNESDTVTAMSIPGVTPIGIEMEFSNLGRRAVDKDTPSNLISNDPFRNLEYYSSFQLEDVTWRLGGYVDTHEHGRRLLTLSRYGGFFEYSMVRVDYSRTYTLPLTCDPAIADQMILESIDFIKEIKPHSLHINIEQQINGEINPKLNDFLCLILLGGDFGYNKKGQLQERRLANREFHRFIKRRKHLNFLSETKKEVIEYAFLRLKKRSMKNDNYQSVILTFKGFQNSYKLEKHCLEQLPEIISWAENPTPLPPAASQNFVKNIIAGLKKEGVYSTKILNNFSSVLSDRLSRTQQIIRSATTPEVTFPKST